MAKGPKDLKEPFCRARDGHMEIVDPKTHNVVAQSNDGITVKANSAARVDVPANAYLYRADSDIPVGVGSSMEIDARPGKNTCKVDVPGAKPMVGKLEM